MSLEGAKFICLDEAGNHGEILVAKGRKFSMGYYVSCDLVLADERAKGVHCEIECDAFGRVTIRNFSPDKPILVNGSCVEIKRILYNNSKLSILDKEYLWQFPKSSSNEFEDLHSDTVSTPQKQIGIPEQPPSSCPDFKLHRELPKRFTVHNFAYCIQSDEEGNTSSADSNDESITEDKEEKRCNENNDQQEVATDKNQTNTFNIELISENNSNDVGKRSVTPEPPVKNDNSTVLLETPKMNLINFTNDKENKSTQKKNKQLLTLCQPSHVVITSFSPRETGVKVEKSFTAIIKPKVQVTKPPTTPKSVYSTPKSGMDIDDDEGELMNFHTPSTSKKASGTASKVLKNSSMHLIDLTTPHKLRHGSPFLKSALKASTKKILTAETTDPSSAKLAVDVDIGLSPLPSTPVVNCSNSGLETPSSVISVSSTDTSSVVEVTSDGSHLGITPSSSGVLITPIKAQVRAGACTPKRTPQSLMKRALLTSAKKQAATPQKGNSCTTTTTTPRREAINRIPLRSNLALLGSPVTPKADKNELQLPRRHSMSTPTRKSISARNRFDNSPTTSNFAASSPSSSSTSMTASRRSSINPISAARALPTSTPLAGSSNNSSFRNRAACKTSPLRKVRKSVGGIPLSSHISKARKSIALPASTSKLTSVREKSPQQIVSGRLLSRARKSFCQTPISTRARNMVTAAKTPPTCPSSILKDTQIERKPSEQRKAVLFADKLPPEGGEMDDLSRTFIVDSDDDDDAANVEGNEKDKPKDATFSPDKEKKFDETDKVSTTINTTFSPEKKTVEKADLPKSLNDEKVIEIPVDVEEITSKDDQEFVEKIPENQKTSAKETNNENNDINNELAVDNKTESIKVNNETPCETAEERNEENKESLAIDNNGDSLVTEESFAEIINNAQEVNEDFVETHNVKDTIEITESPRESSEIEIINDASEDIEKICDTHNSSEIPEGPRESSQTESQESFGDIVNITQDETEEEHQTKPAEEETTALDEESSEDSNKSLAKDNSQESFGDIVNITQDETEEEQQTKPADESTDSPKATLDEERSDDPNQSLDRDKLEQASEVLEIGFGEESIVERLETENPKDNAAEEIKLNEIEDNTHNNHIITKEETIVLTEEDDNVAENNETESNVVDIVQESKITEHLASEEKTIDQMHVLDDAKININEQNNELVEENINIEEEKPEVYKPIYEDITLEGSLIEKETKDLEDHKPIKQPLYEDITLEGSLIEEAEKSECDLQEIKEQSDNRICQETPNDSKNIEQLNVEEYKEVTIIEELETETVEEENQLRSKYSLEEPEAVSVKGNEPDEAKTDNMTDASSNDPANVEQMKINETAEEPLTENNKIIEFDLSMQEDINMVQMEFIETAEEPLTDNNKITELDLSRQEDINVEQMEIIETAEEPQTENNKIVELGLSIQEDASDDHNPAKDSQIVDQLEVNETNEHHKQSEGKMTQEKVQEADALEQLDLKLNRSEIETDENTSKLLEEIEDVLNKSDEIKQKQFEKMQSQDSETPLTEEFECEETNLSETEQTEIITTLEKNAKESENTKQEDQHEEIDAKTTNIDVNIKEIQSHTSTEIEPENVDECLILSKSPEKLEQETQLQEHVPTEIEYPAIVSKTVAQSEETVTETKSQSQNIVAEIAGESPQMLAVEVIPEITKKIIEDTPSVSSIKKKIENTTTLTPRRTRRTSLTTEVTSSLATESSLTPRRYTRRTSLTAEMSSTSQTVEATLTPRRSTRRASMSSETTTNTSTPTKKATRRASLSAANETPLTPKRISSRKSSISVDDKPLLEAKTPRSKTPLKQPEQRIAEENTEDMDAIIEEDEEPTVEIVTSNHENKEIVLDDVAKETDTLESKANENTDEEFLTSKVKNVAEERSEEIVSDDLLELKIKDVAQEIDILESKVNENNDDIVAEEVLKAEEINVFETKVERDDDIEITDKEDVAVTDEVETTKKSADNLKQHEVDKPLLNKDNSNFNLVETIEISDDKAIEKIENITDNAITTNDERSDNAITKSDKAIASIVDETIAISDDHFAEEFGNKIVESKEISTPKSKKSVKIVADSPKTPAMTGLRELLKTPKAEFNTSKFVGIRDLVSTPKVTSDHEEEEVEKLEISKDIEENMKEEVSTPKTKKSIQLLVKSPKTPVMLGMRDLLKTPKADLNTPQLAGIRDLLKTPKHEIKIEEKEEKIEKLAELAHPVKTPKTESSSEEIATTKKSVKLIDYSPKTPIMTGMRELLKTPKANETPKFAGLRNLVQTPKRTLEDSEKLAGLADMVKTPQAKISPNLLVERLEEIPTTSAKYANLRGVKELLKTPKSCSTPRFKGMRELMQTPKMCSTPLMGGIKELMNSPAKVANENMDKFLKTPTAKNIMIPSLPSSAVIEKSTDSIEVSTEYDLNATNEGGSTNLEELFKTPVASRFVERITASYYGEEDEDHEEAATLFNPTDKETLQEKLNKSSEDAFDELTGQESQIQTPIRKIYPRKSLALLTPLAQSPFSTADVLSDLPKTDVEEWIETLDQAETPIVDEDDDEDVSIAVVGEETESLHDEMPDDEASYLDEDSLVKQNTSLTNDESIIPETCAKVYLNEKCLANVTSTSEVMLNLSSIPKTNSKDPLAKTTTKQMPKAAPHPDILMDAEISGIDLLDQTVESVQEEELSMLEEPLIMEEVSIFEENLVVSDNDSEADVTVNNAGEIKEEQHSLANVTLGAYEGEGDEYDLSEPLLVSDSEDLDQSQQLMELTDSQEQLVDIIDLETSEIEDDTSKDSNEHNKSINQKPQSNNNSKDIEKEILENSLIEDVVSSSNQEILSEKTTSVMKEVSKKTEEVSLIEENPNEDTENSKTSISDNERLIVSETIDNSMLEDSIIEDSFTGIKRDDGDSMAKITSITKTVQNTCEIEENIKDETTTEYATNELEILTACQNYKDNECVLPKEITTDSEILMETKDLDAEIISNTPEQLLSEEASEEENIESLDEILQTDETLEQSEILEKEIEIGNENEKKLEITINETRKTSDIFRDYSLNENSNDDIKEIEVTVETSSSNKTKIIGGTLKASPTETKIDFDPECEDIFMDSSINESSKVDDSFADKSTNDEKDVENESAMVEVTTKEMAIEDSKAELTSSEAIEINKEDVGIENKQISKEVKVEDNTQNLSNEEELSLKNEEQLEEFSIAQEISDDENQTAEDISEVPSNEAELRVKNEEQLEQFSTAQEISDDENQTVEDNSQVPSNEADLSMKNEEQLEEFSIAQEISDDENQTVEDISQVPSNKAELSVKNEEQLEEFSNPQEISVDENQTASENVKEQLSEEISVNEISESNKKENKTEKISKDHPTNTTSNVIDESAEEVKEQIKEHDESVSQTNKDTSDNVDKSITETISEDKTLENVSELNKTDKEDAPQTESESSKESSEDINDIVETENKLEETNDENQLDEPVSLHITPTEAKDDFDKKTEEINPLEKKLETTQETSIVDIEKSLDKAEQNLKIAEESKTKTTSESIDLEIFKTNEEESQKSSIAEKSETSKTIKHESALDETTDQQPPQNSEKVEKSTKDISFDENIQILTKESTEVDIAKTSTDQTADNNIEIVQTYDFQVQIIDTESNSLTETKSDNSELPMEHLNANCSKADLELTTNKENVEIVLELNEETVMEKNPENDEQSNVSIEKLVEEDKSKLIEVTESANKEAQITPKETTVCMAEEKRETARTQRRKRTASDSSQGSVHEDDNKSTVRRGRRKVQKSPIEETLVEEIKENDNPTVSTKAVIPDTDIQKEQLVEKEVKEALTEQIQGTEDALTLEDVKPNLNPNVMEATETVVTEKAEEQAPDVLEVIHAETGDATKEQGVKRGRRKPTVSECSQGSVHDDDSSTRRSRRKVQKPQVEPKLLEENLENEELSNMETLEEALLQHKEEIHKVELPIVLTQVDDTILLENAKAEEQLADVPKETNVQPVKRGRRKQTVSESSQSSVNGDDDTTHSQRARHRVQKIRVEEPLVEEELPTTSTANIGQKENKPSTAIESIVTEHLIEEKQVTLLQENQENEELPNVPTPSVVSAPEEETNAIILQIAKAEVPKENKVLVERQEERKEQTVKRGRRKQTVSESSQGSVTGDDDTTHSQRARHKVQKIPVEQPLVEEELPTTSTANMVQKQEKPSTVSTEEPVIASTVDKNIPDLNVNVTEPLIEEKQEHSSDLPQKEENEEKVPQENHVPAREAIKLTVKHGRRKQTVSESSQDSAHNEESSTRRGRRKVLKTPIDKPLVEETLESETVLNETLSSEGLVLAEKIKDHTVESGHDFKHSEDSSQNISHIEQKTLVVENIEQVNEDVHLQNTSTEIKETEVLEVKETEIITVNETEAIEIKESESNKLQEPHSSQVNETKSSVDDVKLPIEEEISTENEQQVEANAAAEVGEQHEVEVVATKRATKRGGRKVTSSETTDVELPKSRSRMRNRKSPIRQPPSTVHETSLAGIPKQEVDASESHKPETIPSSVQVDEIVISDDEIIDIKDDKVQDDHTEKDLKLKLKSTKVRGKRTRTASESSQGSVNDEEPTKRKARQHKQMPDIDVAIVEETENIVEAQTAENPIIDNLTLGNELIEKSSVEETANEKKDDEVVEPHSPPHTIDNEKGPSTEDKPETSAKSNQEEQFETEVVVDEQKNIELTEVQITEVNLEPEEQLSSAEVKEKEVRGRRGRHHVVAEDEHHEVKPATKRRAAVAKNIAVDHQESGPVSKRRVGRRKQDHEQEEHAVHAIHVTADDHENTFADTILHEEPKKGRARKKKDEHPAESEQEKLEMEVSHEESTHTDSASTSSKRRVGRRKQDHEQEENDHNIQVTVDDSKPNENKFMESLVPEEPKKGRSRRKKDEHPEEPEKSTTLHSPQVKPRGRKRKESHTDNQEHHDTEDHHHHEQKAEQQAETKIKLLTEVAVPHTPQRATAAPRRGRKASALDVDRYAHIVAEGAEDTPSKRPLRKAATVYHNYDETSNDAVIPSKAKKRDSPRKSLEAAKSSPSAAVTTSLLTTDPSPTSSSTPAATTARGRTRKPTARVQQFLEEERAKAETPKKRGLLSAVTDVTDTPTPQRMPGRRGRKPSTIDVEVDTVGTPQASRRGRGKAIAHTEELEKETAKVIEEEKETEHTTPPAATVAPAKGRRGGRKAKITAEDHQHHDEDEPPPAKKSPLVLEAEKQEISPELEAPTPTRTAGRRGAATAAKARIEEDALAAAAIDPPKRARARKAPSAKIVAALIAAATDTEDHSSEMDEEQNKVKSLKAEDLNSGENIESSDIVEKPVNKRGTRKVAASTSAIDSPAVPPKRVRKAKTVSEVTDTDSTAGEGKSTRGAGRGRKNVHFDEIQAAEKAAETLENLATTEETSEESAAPVKRGTRTRRK